MNNKNRGLFEFASGGRVPQIPVLNEGDLNRVFVLAGSFAPLAIKEI